MGKTITWTKAMLSDLARLPAGQVAAKHGISCGAVRNKRRAEGVSLVRVDRVPVPHAASRMLGVKTDAFVAKRFGVSRSLVTMWREARGIPSSAECSRTRLDKELRAAKKLGATIEGVVQLTGWPRGRVSARAKELGLTFPRGRRTGWRAKRAGIRGLAMQVLRACGWSAADISEAFGVTHQAVRHQLGRWGEIE